MSRPYEQFQRPKLRQAATENWNNPYSLKQIHSELYLHRRKKNRVKDLISLIEKRLEELESECFRFPSTELKSHSGQMVIIDRQQKGLLTAVGYRTGISGLHEEPRRIILDSLYTKEIPKNTAVNDIDLWGKPKTGKRLKKIVDSLAYFTKQEKANPRGDYSTSISEREADLKYLKKKYYDNSRYDWKYPKT